MQESSPAAIAAKNVELTYLDGTRAVRGINPDVEQDEFFGVLGPDGAGKTTARFNVDDARAARSSIGYMALPASFGEGTRTNNVTYRTIVNDGAPCSCVRSTGGESRVVFDERDGERTRMHRDRTSRFGPPTTESTRGPKERNVGGAP